MLMRNEVFRFAWLYCNFQLDYNNIQGEDLASLSVQKKKKQTSFSLRWACIWFNAGRFSMKGVESHSEELLFFLSFSFQSSNARRPHG